MKTKNLMKVMLACLKETTSKDETRKSMHNKVYHCGTIEKLCSTDGHRMSMLAPLYDKDLKDKAIDVVHFSSEVDRFPSVKDFDASNFYDKLKRVKFTVDKHHVVNTRMPTVIVLYTDGTLSFDVLPDKERLTSLNSAFLKPLIGCSFDLYYKSEGLLLPSYICLDDRTMKSWYIVMPMKDDRFNNIKKDEDN